MARIWYTYARTGAKPSEIVVRVIAKATDFLEDAKSRGDADGIRRWSTALNAINEDLEAAARHAATVRKWATMDPEERRIKNAPTPEQLATLRALGFTGQADDRHHAYLIIKRLEAARAELDGATAETQS